MVLFKISSKYTPNHQIAPFKKNSRRGHAPEPS